MISRRSSHAAFRRVAGLSAALVGMTGLVAFGFTSSAGAAVASRARIVHGASAGRFGGYQDTPTGGLASASVTFTVPTITCTANDEANAAQEFFGVMTDSVSTFAFVNAACTGTGPVYNYFFGTPAGSFDEPGVAPGHKILASLFQSGTSTWAKIHDFTNKDNWFADEGANVGDTVVDIGDIVNTPFNGQPVPTFTKVKFTNATVNGDYLGFESPVQTNAVNGGDLLVQAGKLTTPVTGSTFTDVFKHAT